MERFKILLLSLLCFFCAKGTENLTAISNNLKGPVKSMEYKAIGGESTTLEFDRQGRVIKEIRDNGYIGKYDWSDDGVVTVSVTDKDGNRIGAQVSYQWAYTDNTFVIMMSETRYVGYVDNGEGQLVNKVVVTDGKTAVYVYERDDSGQVTGAKVVSPDNTAPEMDMIITNFRLDSYGNPQRQVGSAPAEGIEMTVLYKYSYYEN